MPVFAARCCESKGKGKRMKRKMSCQQAQNSGAKKRERKVGKGKGKETIPGSCKNPLSPRGREGVSRYRLAGAAAEELVKVLGAKPTEDNRRLWAYYCYHHDIEIIFEKAYRYASEHRQGEVRNPVTAFQRWLTRTYGREV